MHSSTVASRPIALPNAGRSWVGSTRTPRRSHDIRAASGLSLTTSAAHAARIPGSGWTVKHGAGRAAEGERAGDGRSGTLARGLSDDSPTGEAERDKVGSEGWSNGEKCATCERSHSSRPLGIGPSSDRRITRPVIVAGASYRQARMRAQREPVLSPAGTGEEKRLPDG